MRWLLFLVLLVFAANLQMGEAQPAGKPDGNRLAYLDEVDPYYPNRHFPKLITPQWVGEDGVEAVVILAIDDMKEPKKYEAFLRPILRRLQKIDGRAPVSIMSCSVDPKDEQLQSWLKEGLSIECHTFDHPCPFFKPGFVKAKDTYEKCVDLMHAIPNTKPVAFRMPCCDSMNTPSPRFWAEIFNETTAKGNFLTIDSSVFNVFTSDDPALPKELVKDEKGEERFKKYLPTDKPFVNTIENYPYPYVIGKLCWEFPCMTPSDWQAQYLHKANNPQTVQDWNAALDCTVIKQGVFSMVFHPHGWIKNDQVIELIDHAVAKHGKKVKFLTFSPGVHPGEQDNGMVIADLNRDGYQDVTVGTYNAAGEPVRKSGVWIPAQRRWLWEKHDLPLVGRGTPPPEQAPPLPQRQAPPPPQPAAQVQAETAIQRARRLQAEKLAVSQGAAPPQ
jgi:Polysaccharide deacetylase